MVIKQFERLYEEFGVRRVGIVIKWGNVPDWHVKRTMDELRDIVFPVVRHLGEDDVAAVDSAE